MIATITLENIEIYAFHGCYAEEQKVGNRFRVDLTLKYDAGKASQSDFVGDTVNYLKVYESVRTEMLKTSHILENVADRILSVLGHQFPQVIWAEIKIAKLAPPLGGQVQSVSLTIDRKYADI